MSDKTDLDDLAERYLDLWQDQMSSLAGDPGFAEAMGRLMAAAGATGSGAAAAWAAWPAMMAGLMPAVPGKRTAGDELGKNQNAESGAAGATAAGAASGHSGLDLDQLAGRLAELEERVARLESDAQRRKKARSRAREGRA